MKEVISRDFNCEEAVGLLMTYRCNLQCKYCYIRAKQNKDMSIEMAQSILEPFLSRKAGLLDIKLMGGETLLSINVIKPLIEWLESNKWNRPYRVFGSTNGTLLDDNLKSWLCQHKEILTLGLSYDGLPKSQKQNRGNDEVDVDFFIKTWPRQPIQMTINTDSVFNMAEGVKYLLNKGIPVHPNVAFEDYEWDDIYINEYENQLNDLADFYANHENQPLISQFCHDIVEYAENIERNQKVSLICGVGCGLQVYDVDGKIYPCHILSPLVLGEDKLSAMWQKYDFNNLQIEDHKCNGCPFVTSCPTCMGCNYIYRGDLYARDETHCKIMQVEVLAYIQYVVSQLRKKSRLTSEDATLIDAISIILKYLKTKKRRIA